MRPGEIARIVLDAGARAGRLHHLDVEQRALLQPLRFEQLAGRVQLFQPLLQLDLDRAHRLLQRRLRRHVVRIGVDFDELQLVGFLASERIELGDRLDLVAEQRDPPRAIFQMRREHFDGVAAHAEGATRERGIVAPVVQRHEIGEKLVARQAIADLDLQRHRRVGLDRADTVDARHRRDDDHVVALEQ